MHGDAASDRVRNVVLTVAIVAFGYVLPFVAEHLSGPRDVGETVVFLLGHAYFHFYLFCVALTAVAMGPAWYYLEGRPPSRHFAVVGLGYGLVTGIVFAAWYVLLGTTVFSFAMATVYVAILVGIGIVVGTIAGTLRHYTIGYRP